LIGVAGQGAFQAAREISVRMLQDDIDVFRGTRAIAQTEFKRDASLYDELGIASISRALEHTGHDHVRDPGADTSFADAYLARVRLRILGEHAGGWRRTGRRLSRRCHAASPRIDLVRRF